MSQAQWSDTLSLQVAAMDEIHQEFVETLAAMQVAPDGEEFLVALSNMIAHTEDHFAQESTWMRETQFPPIHCHEEEHDKVLAVMREVKNRVVAGDMALGRSLARELMPWLENHAATMDGMLARYIREQGYQAEKHEISESDRAAMEADKGKGCSCGPNDPC